MSRQHCFAILRSSVVEKKDGLEHRFLISYVEQQEGITSRMRMQAKVDLRPSPLKDLMTPHKKVFAEHKQVRAYSLSDEAREKMLTYETNEGDMASKVLKNALKMVVNARAIPSTLTSTGLF